MEIQELLAPFRRAITDYKMIDDGDRVAVGVSGGKDSLTLLSLLKAYQRFSPEKFTLTAVTVDMGFEGSDFSPIAKFCEDKEIDFYLVKTNIAAAIFEKTPDNPCSLCSKMRRGALNTKLIELGCNKLALGHHLDDVIETFFLSLFFEGRLSTFAPRSYMSRTGISLIRPMIYITERDIRGFAKTLPVVKNVCPADKHTQREEMKQLIGSIQKDIPFVKERIFGAISHPERYNLWDKAEERYLAELRQGIVKDTDK
jgi:tRNA 2-thiocytidine biosynthesis protein TtcA